jgi:hypothetical protein
LKGFNFLDKDYVALAHEITHLIQFHLPDFCNRDREIEFEAYTHSHLMTQFLEKYREGMKDEEDTETKYFNQQPKEKFTEEHIEKVYQSIEKSTPDV